MTKRVAVVAGVGPGLGSAIARAFADDGCNVALLARQVDVLTGYAQQGAHGRLHPYPCDVTDPAGVAATFAAIDQALGTPEVVVFNAGAFEPGPVVDIEPGSFERCWRVGCFAGLLVGQQAARRMLTQGHGTILFTGATASLRGGAGFANLASPKFALRALAQSMARELGKQNIHVAHIIVDGQIDMPRWAHLADSKGPDGLLNPNEMAQSYLFLHKQPRSAWTHELDLRPWSERF